jgi:hypothetical protein
VALLSGFYDIVVGLVLLLGARSLALALGVSSPAPAVLGDVTGLFAIAVGIGYLVVLRDLDHHRAYLWVMGPFLKGMGAAAFVRDYLVRGSSVSILLFALTDGALALLTLIALLKQRQAGPQPPGAVPDG